MGTLHEDKYTFLFIFRTLLVRMRNVVFNNFFPTIMTFIK